MSFYSPSKNSINEHLIEKSPLQKSKTKGSQSIRSKKKSLSRYSKRTESSKNKIGIILIT